MTQVLIMHNCILPVSRVRDYFFLICSVIFSEYGYLFSGDLWWSGMIFIFYLCFPPCSVPCHFLRRDPLFHHSDFHISLSFCVSCFLTMYVDFPVHHRDLHPQSATFIYPCSLLLPLSLFCFWLHMSLPVLEFRQSFIIFNFSFSLHKCTTFVQQTYTHS